MKRKHVALLAVTLVVLAVAGFGIKMLNDVNTYREQVEAISISNIDLSKVKDGTFF